MKGSIENKITMFKTVFTHCIQNIAIIAANAGLNGVFLEFAALFALIQPTAQIQIKNNKGITKNKKDSRILLVNGLFKAAGVLMSHFSGANDHEIYDKVNINKSTMIAMRDIELSVHSQNVIDLITEHQVVLLPFGVNAAYIVNLETLRDAFADRLALPTVASDTKKAATSDLSEEVHIVEEFLKTRLDPAMRVLVDSEPVFYKKYVNGRKTHNVGIRHKNTKGTLHGIVKDEETHHIITDALIEIVNTLTMIVTNELGEFTIMGIPPGTYTIKISVGGYEIKTIENIIIVAKQVTEIEINLTPAV